MLYLYAFAEPSATLPETGGIGGAALRLESIETVEAVVGELGVEAEATEEAVLAHARVVDELASLNAAVVPVRFGAAFRDVESLRRAVAPRAHALVGALGRVRGCVELGVRVLAPAPPEQRESGSGRAYMVTRLDEVRRAERLGGELHAPLAELARASDHRVHVTPQLLLSAAYLVERDRVATFRGVVEELAASREELSFACTGPWPAYSFGTLDLDSR